jgi:thioesterase domain-containing protein
MEAGSILPIDESTSDFLDRGGEKITPEEIDEALLRHPSVAEAAAFGVPHPRLGEDVAAAVVLQPGAAANPAELRRFLMGQLTSFKIPQRIIILDRLPRDVSGRVQRQQIAERLIERSGGSTNTIASPPVSAELMLEAQLLQLWRKLLNSEAVTSDHDFFEAGGDSLLATQMLIEIERIVGHPVSDTILFETGTIRQLVKRITQEDAAASPSAIQIPVKDDQCPLFFFHGDIVTRGYYVQRLVNLLGPDHPIVPVAPHGLRGEAVPKSIEDMAADRLSLVLEQQPKGPYRLGGHCNGSLVAFEVARLLVGAGHEVEMVVMIDPPSVSARPVMRALLKGMQQKVSPRRLAWTYNHLARIERASKLSLKQFFAKARARRAEDSIDYYGPAASLQETYAIAMSRYLPAPLSVPVIFFAAAHDGRAWRRLSPDLEVIEVPGGHTDCVRGHAEPLVEHLRQKIRAHSGQMTRLA